MTVSSVDDRRREEELFNEGMKFSLFDMEGIPGSKEAGWRENEGMMKGNW